MRTRVLIAAAVNSADLKSEFERLGKYFSFYNTERPHQAFGYRTPAEVYYNVHQPSDRKNSDNGMSFSRGSGGVFDCE